MIVYPNPQVETDKVQRYRELLNSERVRRIYLNELEIYHAFCLLYKLFFSLNSLVPHLVHNI